jgi:putative FmdB family regulatory protein
VRPPRSHQTLMPIFEYTCKKCGKVFEKLVLGRNGGKIICPKCGSKKTGQIFSSFATASSGHATPSASCGSSGGT